MNTPLTKFFATVGFKVDTSAWDATIRKVRYDIASLRKNISPTVKLKYDKKNLTLPSFVNQTVKLKYVGASPTLSPVIQSRLLRPTPLPVTEVVRRKVEQPTSLRLGVGYLSLKDAKLTHVPKIKLQASTLSLKDVRLTYVPKVKLQGSSSTTRTTSAALTPQQKLENRVARDRTAASLKWQRLQDRQRSAEEKAEQKRLDDWHRRQEKAAQKLERDAAARRIRELRSQGAATRLQAAREAATRREDNRRWQQMRAEANFMNREFNLRRREAARMHSEALRMNAQVDRQRLQQRLQEHSEALRMNREMDRLRRVQNRPPSNTGGNTRGGNTNPWHIGTMAGGLGGLITRGNLAAVGAGAGLQQMYTTANFTAAREPRYEFLTGSKEGGAKQIKYINELVDELHLDLIATDNSYTQFLGAVNSSIGADKAQKTFKTIQSFGMMMGSSPESLQRGTKAIQQMLSKQKLSAEELTGEHIGQITLEI